MKGKGGGSDRVELGLLVEGAEVFVADYEDPSYDPGHVAGSGER